MKLLTNQLKAIREALAAVSDKTYHYEKPAEIKAPYIVWAELGESESFHGDNRKKEQAIYGAVDYFTLTEFDSTIDEIQAALDGVSAWNLDTVQYEDETKLIHYTWNFEVS